MFPTERIGFRSGRCFLGPGPGPLTSNPDGSSSMSSRSIPTVVALSVVTWLGAGRGVAAAETYAADPAHSSVVYRVKHMNTSHSWGRFNDISGAFTLDDANPAA